MFGVFALDSINAVGDTLKAVASNEVFQFTITFSGCVSAFRVFAADRDAERLESLRADHEVLMRGNTFFKLSGSPYSQQFGRAGDAHYLIAAPNYTVDILAAHAPSVTLTQAKKA